MCSHSGAKVHLMHTPIQRFRADEELWQEFRQACIANGTTASEQLRAGMRLYLALNDIRVQDEESARTFLLHR